MANSKKLIDYTGSQTTVSVPTAINTTLLREIGSDAFQDTVETVVVDTYANDVGGAPWGAQNVVWKKEPIATLSFNANGGKGTMLPRIINTGIATKIPTCQFRKEDGNFLNWNLDSISGVVLQPNEYYAFSANATLFANWSGQEGSWKDNNKSTIAEANAEGWQIEDNAVIGFTSTVNPSSVYNIPKLVGSTQMEYVAGMGGDYDFPGISFVSIGGTGINTIYEATFYNCFSLTTASFPACTSIGDYAFCMCENLTSIYIPNCSYIGNTVFALSPLTTSQLSESCIAKISNSIHTFLVEPNWDSMGSQIIDSDVTFVTKEVLGWQGNLQYISFPNCKYVAESAFTQCCSLSSVYLPKCSCIEPSAFYECSQLQNIDITSCAYIPTSTFENCYNLSSISLPYCSYIDERAFYKCSSLSYLYAPQCKCVSSAAFDYCINLSSVNLPTCSRVGQIAFAVGRNISFVSLPSCSIIEENAFFNCTNLTTISIPVCSTIASAAFGKCSCLTNVVLPNTIKSIGSYAFFGCTFSTIEYFNSIYSHVSALRAALEANGATLGTGKIGNLIQETANFSMSMLKKMYSGTYVVGYTWEQYCDDPDYNTLGLYYDPELKVDYVYNSGGCLTLNGEFVHRYDIIQSTTYDTSSVK